VFVWLGENRSSRTIEVEMRERIEWKTAASLAMLLMAGAALVLAADDAKPPASTTSGDAEYRLGAEDVIEVFVWKEPDLSTTVVVRPDGRISLPLANELVASGKTAVELQQEITARLSKYAIQPVVNVMVKQVNSLKISVLGEVRRPDVYRIKNRVTVLDAIAMAGGFTDLARPNKVIVLRNTSNGQQRIRINIKQVVDDDTAAPLYLQTLDTVYVE
jgi:polysaccharide export outer membrane protein